MNPISRQLLKDVGRYYLVVAAWAVACYVLAFAIRGRAATAFLPWFLMVHGAISVACVPAMIDWIKICRNSRDEQASRQPAPVSRQLLGHVGKYYLQTTVFALLTYLLVVTYNGWNWIPLHGWLLTIVLVFTLPYLPVMYRMIKYARSQRTD